MKLSVSIGLLSISLVLLPIISLAEITAADAINSMIRDRELEWEEAEKICFNSTEDEPLKCLDQLELVFQQRREHKSKLEKQKFEAEYEALKLSRQDRVILMEDLPSLDEWTSTAEEQIKSLCLYTEGRTHMHCGYFYDYYVSEMSLFINENFLWPDEVKGIIIQLEPSVEVVASLRKDFADRPNVLLCLENVAKELRDSSSKDINLSCDVLVAENFGKCPALELSYLSTIGWNGTLRMKCKQEKSRGLLD